MNSLQLNFETLRQGPFKPVFEALEAGFREFGIDYYIIGAFARDLWLEDNKYLPDRRATLDLDLAIYIAEWKQQVDPTDKKIGRWRLVLAIMDGIQKLPSK